jgi:gliding motility-associated-like protein
MSNELDQFEQSIKNALDGLSMPYDDQAWEKLSDALNKEIPTSSSSGSSFNSGIIVGVAATVLTVVGVNVPSSPEEQKNIKDQISASAKVIELVEEQPSVVSVAPIITTETNDEAIVAVAVENAIEEEISEVSLKHVVVDNEASTEVTTTGVNNLKNTDSKGIISSISPSEQNQVTIQLELTNHRICLGESPQVVVTSNQLLEDEQLWLNGELVEEPIVLKKAGTYKLQSKGRLGFDWFESNVEELVVVKAPKANIHLQKWNDDFGRQRVRAEQSASQVTPLQWVVNGKQFHSSSIELALESAGEYQIQVVAESNDGCLDTANTSVYVDAPYNLLAPTAFTPNGDGRNDSWFPAALKGKSVPFKLEIKDKSGNTVFVSKDPNQEWDGAQAQAGDVFAWTAVVYFKEAEASTYHGTIFIVE